MTGEDILDTLSKVLDLLHFQGALYFSTNFNGPWGLRVPQYKNVARFHYVTQGQCWIKLTKTEDTIRLSAGDMAIIPHGVEHILSDHSERAPVNLEDSLIINKYNGEGYFSIGNEVTLNDTQLICGHFEFGNYSHPLLEHLPDYIHRNENEGLEFSWLKDNLHFMAHAAKKGRVGSSAIIKRLSEIIFIQSIQYWHQGQKETKGFLAAINDPNLSKGLKAFHDDASAHWTVDKLAEESCMSRSLFSAKFKEFLDLSPMQYVTYWRMQRARSYLSETDMSIETITTKTGYETLAAFSKAFKRTIGKNPGEYRRDEKEKLQLLRE